MIVVVEIPFQDFSLETETKHTSLYDVLSEILPENYKPYVLTDKGFSPFISVAYNDEIINNSSYKINHSNSNHKITIMTPFAGG